MSEVLVLVDHVDGEVRKTTAELLTLATRLGEPSAVFIGDGFDAAKDYLAKYGGLITGGPWGTAEVFAETYSVALRFRPRRVRGY